MTQRANWIKFKDFDYYLPDRFEKDGFIHTSKLEQVLPTANRLYLGEKDLVILEISEDKVRAKIVEEPSSSGELFVHIYGSLNKIAVNKIYDFPCEENGEFKRLPWEEK